MSLYSLFLEGWISNAHRHFLPLTGFGLPNKGKSRTGEIMFFYPNFPLRLYALRVNNRTDLVILFNGGVKSASTNQGSDDLRLRWIEACQFAKRIEQALQDVEIVIDGGTRRLRYYNGDDEIFL